MDGLFNLMDERIDKRMANAPYVNAVPCSVLSVSSNGMVKVKLVSNGVIYTVPNYSGSAVNVGENVQLFYRGGVLSERSAYVGAAKYKSEGSGSITAITGSSFTGALLVAERRVAKVDFENKGSAVLIGFNATVYGDAQSVGSGTFKVYVNNVAQSYTPAFSVGSGEYGVVSFTLPFILSQAIHTIAVNGSGSNATVSDAVMYAYGEIESTTPSYDPTGDNDYIYNIADNKANVMYYVGSTQTPQVPLKLNNTNVDKLECTAFNYTNVEGVYIPEGVTKIE